MENTQPGEGTAPKTNNKCPIWLRLILIFGPLATVGLSLYFGIMEILRADGRVNLGVDFNDYGSQGFRVMAVILGILTIVFFVLQFVLPKAVFKKRVVSLGIVLNAICLIGGIAGGYIGGSLIGTHDSEKETGANGLIKDVNFVESEKVKLFDQVNEGGKNAIIELAQKYGAVETNVTWIRLAQSSGTSSSASYKAPTTLENYDDFLEKVAYTSELSKDGETFYYYEANETSSKYDLYMGEKEIASWVKEKGEAAGVTEVDEGGSAFVLSEGKQSKWGAAYGTHKSKANKDIKPIYPAKYDYTFSYNYETVEQMTSTSMRFSNYSFTCYFDLQNGALRIGEYTRTYTVNI